VGLGVLGATAWLNWPFLHVVVNVALAIGIGVGVSFATFLSVATVLFGSVDAFVDELLQ